MTTATGMTGMGGLTRLQAGAVLPAKLISRVELELERIMTMLGRTIAGLVIGLSLCWATASIAQAPSQDTKTSVMDNSNANGNANANDTTAPPLDQIVTKTVHEAWVASGRNEDKWFGMVEQLAELSAQNRGVTLPDTREAGSRFGESIKKEARKDPDQLLYAVVDRAVRRVGKTQTSTTASGSAPNK